MAFTQYERPLNFGNRAKLKLHNFIALGFDRLAWEVGD